MVATVGGLTKRGLYFEGTLLPQPTQFSPQVGERVNEKTLAVHLKVDRYGDFRLTAAIRPSPALSVVPRQGYRIESYRDAKSGMRVPVLAASVSREGLFEAFLSLLDPLGPVVDVVLETSHEEKTRRQGDRETSRQKDSASLSLSPCLPVSSPASYCRSRIDLPVLESYFCDFEELLLNDGCTGVAVIGTTGPMEVQFDEHKLLIVYAHDLKPFERIVRQVGLARDDGMKLITEGEHIHTTDARYTAAFDQLCYRLGIGETAEHVSW
jgi:hypothetical protein